MSSNNKKSTDKTNDIGLNTGLQGSAMNYADNVHMQGSQGHGFAAEKMNNLLDQVQGKDAQIIGGDNAKNGADRIVDGINIQTKYCATGSRCVNECFDERGTFRYINQDGTPMQIEVPSDKYQDAINSMEDKIRKGKIPGISDPNEANKIIRKGSFTYQQAKNMAQAGTIESLTYDAVNGVRLAGTSMGISAAMSFAVAVWNGEEWDIALKNSVYTGLKVGGIAWVSSILTAQLGRTGLEQALRGTTDYLVKSMGTKATHFLANGLRSGSKIYGAAAINNVSKLLRGNIVTGIATTLVLSSKDFYRLFNGQISGAQLFKNIARTGAGVAGGIGGWMGGAATGAAIGSAIPIVGTAAGGIIGGLIGSFAGGSVASKTAEVILDEFIEDDAKQMLSILEKNFSELSSDYLINEDEANIILEEIKEKDLESILWEMFASNDADDFAREEILEPIIIKIIEKRPKIKLPSDEDMIEEIGLIANEQIINDLDINEKWKNKFRIINSAKLIENTFFGPSFKNNENLVFKDNFNFLATLFGPIYYIIKGMWKKALILPSLHILMIQITAYIGVQYALIGLFGFMYLVGRYANVDYYRLKVRGESFWW